MNKTTNKLSSRVLRSQLKSFLNGILRPMKSLILFLRFRDATSSLLLRQPATNVQSDSSGFDFLKNGYRLLVAEAVQRLPINS